MAERGRPVISVAIATRNYGRYLPRALDSVFRSHNPTGVPIQVVVADDASTDNTRAILADYRQRYPKNLEVVLIRMPEGIGAAKNAALDRCRGRTVAILDADDEFLPDKLARCHAVIEGGGVDIVTHDFFHRTEGEGVVPRTRRGGESWRTWGQWFWPPSTWVFRNGVVRFNPHSMGAEDLEWLDRCRHSLRPRHLDLLLSVQHVHLTRTQGRASGHYGVAWDSWTPASQLTGRILNGTHAYERLAPPAWSCRVCGNLYLLPARCCGREAVEQPLLFYWTILSPYHPAQTEFSLVMLTRNRLPLTQKAVGSILARIPVEQRRDVELIFVDGYSTDGTVDYIRELAKTHPVKLILTHPEEPFVFSRACNRGAHAARGKYLLLLNNDIELRSEDPWGALRTAFQDPRVGVVGASAVWHPWQRDAEWTAGLLPDGSPPYLYVKRPLTGEFWGARREVYWGLGGMDEAFTGYGHDELDFEYRALLAHYHLALARVRVHHELHATFASVVKAERMRAMERENRQLFVRKHRGTIHSGGTQVERFASHLSPALSLVITTQTDASRLRKTLARAVQDPRCHDGSLQVVVVDNGSTDDTAVLLEAYRLRLPRCLSVISLPVPVAPTHAGQIGQARCIGPAIQSLTPGDWPAAPGQTHGSARVAPPGERREPAPNRAPADARSGAAPPRTAPVPFNRAGQRRSAGPGVPLTGAAARLSATPPAQKSARRPHVFAHSSGALPPGAGAAGTGGFDYPVTQQGSTDHFNVYFQTALGAAGQAIADGVLRSCERDYHVISDWFGGITPPGLPCNVIIAALSPGRDGKGGAYHHDCAAVDLYEDVRLTPRLDIDLTRMLVVAEEVEVFEAAQRGGWDCGASNGEGLSRVLAMVMYPHELTGYATAARWLDSADRPDYVNRSAPTDTDMVANGCAVLFLNWLRDGLGYGWDQIVQAAAPTLAQTYTRLTGRGDGWMRFRVAIDALFPPDSPSGLTTDNPFRITALSMTARRMSPRSQRDSRHL